MKRAIILAMLLLPATALADDYYDQERNTAISRIADEMRYQQEWREYEYRVKEFEKAYPEDWQRSAMKHYYWWPQPPQR